MRNYFCLPLIICCLGLITSEGSYGQSGADSSNLRQKELNNAEKVFSKAIGQQSGLYNGPKYLFYNPLLIRGSAYFEENTSSYGNVNYNGAEYEGVQLIYDLHKDELIALLYDNASNFYLLKDYVKNFDLLGHHFININTDTLSNNSTIKSGYYDELYRGRTQILARITKKVEVNMSSTGTMEAFSSFTLQSEDFFVRKNNIYYSIASEGALLRVLKDRNQQLQRYIKTNKIKFRKDPAGAMATIAAFYDSLPN
jgi:hypothetical protein